MITNTQIRRFLLIALVLLCLIPWIAIASASAHPIYVNADTGSDTTGDGTQANPYQTFTRGYQETEAGGTLDLTGTFTWTDAAETGVVDDYGFKIEKDITIQGHGVGNTIIQAADEKGDADSGIFYRNQI